MTTHVIEGSLVVPKGGGLGIVASRFNHFIVDRLVEGALDALARHGAQSDGVTVVRVPGAWELPFIARRLPPPTEGTPGGDVPVVFGVLTTETIEQAIERAGTKAGNKGWDAAVTAIEMVGLSRALADAGF